MSFSNLTDFYHGNSIEFYRDSLLKPILRSVNKLVAKDKASDCTKQLRKVFEQWKNEHGEAVPKNQFLRTTSKAADKFRTRLTHADFDFEDSEPYQCAGYGVRNYTDLAFKLWLDDYPPFMSLGETYQLDRVLAVANYILDLSCDPKLDHMDSLIRLSCHIYEMEVFILKHMTKSYRDKYLKEKKIKTHTGLNDEARAKAAKVHKQRSAESKTQFRKIAKDIWEDHRSYNYDKIADVLYKDYNFPKNKSGEQYSFNRIRTFIGGFKNEL